MKKLISKLLLITLLTGMMSISSAAASSIPTASIYTDHVSHYTDKISLRFKLSDDKSLKNGFFVFLDGHPNNGGKQLYAEQITEDSNSVRLTREIDITSCGAYDPVDIYLVVIDADGNESAYDEYVHIVANTWRYPAIRVKNPLPDNKSHLYGEYIGTYPTFSPSITITDHDSKSFTCKYYVDSVLKETKQVNFSSTGTNTVNFSNIVNTSSLSNMMHSITFEVSDGSYTSTYKFYFIKL